MGTIQLPAKLDHSVLGVCELIRIEGTIWVVRREQGGVIFRIPSSRRGEFRSAGIGSPQRELATTTSLPADQTELGVDNGQPEPSAHSESVLAPKTIRRYPQAPLASRLASRKIEPSPQPRTVSRQPQHTVSPPAVASSPKVSPAASMAQPPVTEKQLDGVDPHRFRRMIHSLRIGLTPADQFSRYFAVGTGALMQRVDKFLSNTKIDGGDALVIRGAYGQGKTFALEMLSQAAVAANYMVVRTEIDAAETRLDKPHNVYASMMRSLQIPGENVGVESLVRLASEWVRTLPPTASPSSANHSAFDRPASTLSDNSFVSKNDGWHESGFVYDRLMEQLGCEPLAWILSDPHIAEKPQLIKLLAGDVDVVPTAARRSHVRGGKEHEWPRFRYGTQGDFGSCLLSGLGLLSRQLGFNGLIILLDEMEKWQDLKWSEQARAGNFLGGLIWAATAETGRRSCASTTTYYGKPIWAGCDHSEKLAHAGWAGGHRFTTESRCHVGLAMAMTPRGAESPEAIWREFGRLSAYDLPEFDPDTLKQYVAKLCPLYGRAYKLSGKVPGYVVQATFDRWRQRRDRSARSAVTAAVEALDEWRSGLDQD